MTVKPSAIFISAPFDSRWCPSSCFPWTQYRAFQPLFGFDAQITNMAGYLIDFGIRPYILAAPELFPSTSILESHTASSSDSAEDTLPPIHLRFGSLRSPGLLKGARNFAVLAEELTTPIYGGDSPFASARVVPEALIKILTYSPPRHNPTRLSGQVVPVAFLPDAFLSFEQQKRIASNDGGFSSQDDLSVVLEAPESFQIENWNRKSTQNKKPAAEALSSERFLVGTGPWILAPWNLAHPGSTVPDLARKVQALGGRDRCPVTLVVAPFNDSAMGLSDLAELAQSLVHGSDSLSRRAVLFTRAKTLSIASDLASRCRRAWIDRTDPEWAWTTTRLRRLGMKVNFVSSAEQALSRSSSDGTVVADEIIRIRGKRGSSGLEWRSLTLSSRAVAALAAAVAQDADSPLPPLVETTPAYPTIETFLGLLE